MKFSLSFFNPLASSRATPHLPALSSQTAGLISSKFWHLLKSSLPAQFCYTSQSQGEPGFGLSAADVFKADGLGFEEVNTCSMVKARKCSKVKTEDTLAVDPGL